MQLSGIWRQTLELVWETEVLEDPVGFSQRHRDTCRTVLRELQLKFLLSTTDGKDSQAEPKPD